MTRHSAAPFILVTVALDALGFGIVIPVEPGLVKQLGGGDATSFWLGAILTTFSAAQFLASPVLGALSDRFGRRPVLLVSLAAQGAAALATVFVPNLFWFFVIRGLAGASSGNVAAATAYIADVSTEDERPRRFGWIGAMYGLGFVLGPAAGGILGAASVRLPFLASAVLAGGNVIYGAIVLAESLAPERRRAFEWRRANPLGALRGLLKDQAATRLAIVWCCLWFAIGAQQSSFILANQMRFHWNTLQNGLVLAGAGAASAVTQGLLIGRVERWIGMRRTGLTGVAFCAAGYLCYALAATPWIMFPGVLILAIGALANPAVQAMFSRCTGAGAQGSAQGELASLQGLMAVVAPLIMGTLFALATRHGGHFPGAPFLLAAVICAAGCLVLWGVAVDV